MKRAEYGSLKSLTDKEYKQHKAEISQRWRETHPDEVKEYNRVKYLERRKRLSYEVICKICGKKFMSYRKEAKICQKCLKARKKH